MRGSRVIPARFVEVQPEFRFMTLSRVLVIRGGRAVRVARLAESRVAQFALEGAVRLGSRRLRMEVHAPGRVLYWLSYQYLAEKWDVAPPTVEVFILKSSSADQYLAKKERFYIQPTKFHTQMI
jgi:hypothetical protein